MGGGHRAQMPLTATLPASATLAALVLFAATATGHNWVNTPARVIGVHSSKYCAPKADPQQTHYQANPGQQIPIEWSTGHGTSSYFTLLKASDEPKMFENTADILDDYLMNAPGGATTLEHIAVTQYERAAREYPTFNTLMRCKEFGLDKGKFDPELNDFEPAEGSASTQEGAFGKQYYYKGSVFGRQLEGANAPHRPDSFRRIGNGPITFWEYSKEIPEACRTGVYAGYESKKYPWLQAVLFNQIHTKEHPGDGDRAMLPLPEFLKPGKYILQWWWQGYSNCIDINIVPKEKPVTDMFGFLDDNMAYQRIDHCAFRPFSYGRGSQSRKTLDTQLDVIKQKSKAAGDAKKKQMALEAAVVDYQAQSDAKREELKVIGNSRDNARQSWSDEKAKVKNLRNAATDVDWDAVGELEERYNLKVEEYNTAKEQIAELETAKRAAGAPVQPAKVEARDTYAAYWKLVMPHHMKMWVLKPQCAVIPAGSSDVSACLDLCDSEQACNAVNIAPFGKFGGQIPWHCNNPDMVDAKDGDLVCWGQREGGPDDGGPARRFAPNDPDDPVFYQTCFKKSYGSRSFEGNTCGDKCLVSENEQEKAAPPRWRYGNKCISCELAKFNMNTTARFVPRWELASTCRKCKL